MNMPENEYPWNQIVYFVSDVYSITRKFPLGDTENLGMRMRRAAVAVSAAFNFFPAGMLIGKQNEHLYPLLSSIAILETYLVLTKNRCIGVNLDGIDENLQRLKKLVVRLMEEE